MRTHKPNRSDHGDIEGERERERQRVRVVCTPLGCGVRARAVPLLAQSETRPRCPPLTPVREKLVSRTGIVRYADLPVPWHRPSFSRCPTRIRATANPGLFRLSRRNLFQPASAWPRRRQPATIKPADTIMRVAVVVIAATIPPGARESRPHPAPPKPRPRARATNVCI